MVPTFILTRTFAISALFVGAFPVAYAAPIPNTASAGIAPRGCRQMSCLYALPTGNTDTSNASSSSAATFPALQIPQGGFSQESMQMLDFLISALTSARSAAAEASSAVIQPTVNAVTVDAVTVDGFVPTVDAVVPVVEGLATKVASAEEESSPVASYIPSLDALE
ncbi:hypothetical protein C8Q74DRAFT_1369983 [Fomes fomentarius]|nr:hypothetical protein C8Q74DRAFT_1369983 [Fomes fomentarius]